MALAGAAGAQPLGFDRDREPHASAISRALAGAPFAQLQEVLLDWMRGVVSNRELSGPVDGKWAQQSPDAAGQPLAMANVLAHELKVCLAQCRCRERGTNQGALREQLAGLFERYPGLRLLTRDALYVEQDLCQAISPVKEPAWAGLLGTGEGASPDGPVRPVGSVGSAPP